MKKSEILRVNKKLFEKFGLPRRDKKLPDPVDMLIATILSQNTNDKNSFSAYKNLKENFSSWEEIAKLPEAKIEKFIKQAGLGKQKSKAIKKFLNSVKLDVGKITLDPIKKLDNEKAIEQLTAYEGVGVKTASCVLLFSLDRNICPVDTHVHRTLNRIGLVKTSAPDKTFFAINKNFPEKIAHQFHTNLIRLGREICKPSRPDCLNCPLLKICRYDQKNLSEQVKYRENDFMLLDNISDLQKNTKV